MLNTCSARPGVNSEINWKSLTKKLQTSRQLSHNYHFSTEIMACVQEISGLVDDVSKADQ